MDEIPSRDLRNHTAEILRRVERGETLEVTVRGRPVARLSPTSRRPDSIPWDVLWTALGRVADASLGDDLRRLLPDTTDDAA